MDLQLKNKTAFISGSTSGIGYATARLLLEEGANVVINGRSSASVNTAVNELKALYPNTHVMGIPADFSDVNSINQLIKQLPQIDILINNVATYYPNDFFTASDEEWMSQFEVNVMSGVRMARALLPHMLDRNWGRILFISSECATLVPADLIPYSVTKTAVLSVSRAIAELTKNTGVTVNSIVPGSTLSEGAKQFLQDVAAKENKTTQQVADEFFTNVRTSSLLGRFASVDEVASTIVYYASPLAAATNGAAVKVDGGSMGGVI